MPSTFAALGTLRSLQNAVNIGAVLRRYNLKKLTYEERKARLIERLNAFNAAADEGDSDD